MKFHSQFFSLVFCLLLASFFGCGKNVSMGGKVTFSDDNSPLTVGTVCFATDTFYARGKLDASGNYTLGFDQPGNGLPKGEYKVYIADATVPTGSYKTDDGEEMAIYSPVIAEKYTTKGATDLKVTVDGSTRTFDFKVDRASAKK